jgi:hypothetical protein
MDGDAVREYVKARRAILREEGLDPEMLEANVRDGTAGTSTLVRFFDALRP